MIPNQIKIGGMIYNVTEEENMESHYDHFGQIVYGKGIIRIDSNLSDVRKEQVLVHEMLHGIFFEAGIQEQDEDVINRVALVLHQVMKDNDMF